MSVASRSSKNLTIYSGEWFLLSSIKSMSFDKRVFLSFVVQYVYKRVIIFLRLPSFRIHLPYVSSSSSGEMLTSGAVLRIWTKMKPSVRSEYRIFF